MLLDCTAHRALIEARLAHGDHVDLVPELELLAEQHPHREAFHRQLMVALYRCGRQAGALAVYRRLRAALVNELEMDPGPAVRDLHAAILRQDPDLALPATNMLLIGRRAAVPSSFRHDVGCSPAGGGTRHP